MYIDDTQQLQMKLEELERENFLLKKQVKSQNETLEKVQQSKTPDYNTEALLGQIRAIKQERDDFQTLLKRKRLIDVQVEEEIRFNFYISKDINEHLKAISTHGISKSGYIRSLILEDMKKNVNNPKREEIIRTLTQLVDLLA